MKDTNVFISWSGEKSRQLGQSLREWLPIMIQRANPYFTPSDIDKGSVWYRDIANHLDKCRIGLICLTSDNLDSQWIPFEAGALSRGLGQDKVCPILFDILNRDIPSPLAQYQATKFEKDDFFKLVSLINDSMEDEQLDESTLKNAFQSLWPSLEENIKQIMDNPSVGSEHRRPNEDILDEILYLVRSISMRTNTNRTISDDAAEQILLTVISLHQQLFNISVSDQELMDILSRMKPSLEEIRNNFQDVNPDLNLLIDISSSLDYRVSTD